MFFDYLAKKKAWMYFKCYPFLGACLPELQLWCILDLSSTILKSYFQEYFT